MKKKLLALCMACVLPAGLALCACRRGEELPASEEETVLSGESIGGKQENILTHVYREREIDLPAGFVASGTVEPEYRDGMVRLYCTRDNRGTEEGLEHIVYVCPIDGGEGEAISLPLGNLHANNGLVAGDRVYLTDISLQEETYEQLYNLYAYDLTTGQLNRMGDFFSLFPKAAGDRPRILDMAVDGEGYLYIACDEAVCVLNPDMTPDCTLTDVGYTGNLATDGDGVVCLLGGSGVQTIDRAGRCVPEGTAEAVPASLVGAELALGEGYPLYAVTEEGLLGVQGETTTLLADWQNSNVCADNLSGWKILSPETVLTYGEDRWFFLEKGADVDLSDVTVVHLAYVADIGLGIREEQLLRENLVAYNKAHPETRVLATDYGIYGSKENPEGGVDRLLADMTGGLFIPDLVFGPGNGKVISTLLDSGLYTDLYTCMEGEIRPADIVGAVKNTYEMEGKLAVIPINFQLRTLLAPRSVVGDADSWTLAEMLDMALALPADVHLMDRATAEEWIGSGLAYASFLNLEAGSCAFDTPVFRQLLTYMSTLPENAERAANVYEPWQTGRTVLYPCVYKGILDYQKDPVVYNGEEYVRIGYPDVGHRITETAIGSSGSPAVYLIPSTAAAPAAAWQFVEAVITSQPEMAMMSTGNIRTLRSQNETAKEIFSPYTSFYMYNGQYAMWMGDRNKPDENGRIYGQPGVLVPWSEELFDRFTAWLEEAGAPFSAEIPAEVLAIIEEEVSTCTAGGRSVEETAAILQSRVSLWLAERN